MAFNLAAQDITMSATGNLVTHATPGSSFSILDPGGEANYPGNCNSRLTIISDDSSAISLSGSYTTESGTDILYVYEGASSGGALLGLFSGTGNLSVTAYTGAITLIFWSDPLVNYPGFNLSVSVCDTLPMQIRHVAATNISHNSATLSWNDTTGTASWTVTYGTSTSNLEWQTTSTTPSVTLTGLSAATRYWWRVSNGNDTSSCPTILRSFKTLCNEVPPSCIDYSNLSSCFVSARYGHFANADAGIGIIDSGYSNAASRHTIHTDTSERDPRTGGLLRTVPAGFPSSVRLGNWLSGGEAESITYEYQVDSTINGLLIMKYAAVLQNPNHSADQQPRFTFSILDDNGEEINASCYSAQFVASTALGWNSATTTQNGQQLSVLWKDWITVGIDLAPLHGETIHVKLTTFDCARQEHFGYAYFVFSCAEKNMDYENCGSDVENTFTVPEGFSYRWTCNDDTTTLSTSRSLHVTQPGDYHCTLRFLGSDNSTSCSFEMTATASQRHPAAIIAAERLNDDCNPLYLFRNLSVISLDSAHQQLTSTPCDAIQWIVDGIPQTPSSDSLSFVATTGQHSVQLVASLSGGCTDTAFYLIDIPLNDTVIAHEIVENQTPYLFAGSYFSNNVSDTTILLTDSHGCDSVIHFSLTVWPNIHSSYDTTVCPDALPLLWHGITFDSTDFTGISTPHTSSKQLILSGTEPHGADSILSVTVTRLDNSTMTLHDTVVENQLPVTVGGLSFSTAHADTSWVIANAAGCDSIISFSLHVWPNIYSSADSTLCRNMLPLLWNGHLFNNEGSFTLNLASIGIHGIHGEDSTITMSLNILENSSNTIADTIVQNSLPYSAYGFTFNHAVDDTSWVSTNAVGCDSTTHFSLHVWNNYSHQFFRTVCDNELPLEWCGEFFLEGGDITQSLLSVHGADSTVTLTLSVNPTYSLFDTGNVCINHLPFLWQGSLLDSLPAGLSNFSTHLTSVNNCDSTVNLALFVNPVYQFSSFDTICVNRQPYLWQDSLFDNIPTGLSSFSRLLESVHGCDSLLTLNLTVNPTSHLFDYATVCDGRPFTWIDGVTYSHTTYDPTITFADRNGCDSVRQLILNLDNGFEAAMLIDRSIVDPVNPTVTLRDISQSESRLWFFDYSTDTSRVCSFEFPVNADSLQVLLVARSHAGCIDSVWGIVFCDRTAIWPPNAFTPDEPINNRFFIPSNGLASAQVWVFNRQGLLVATFDGLSGSWDGTHNGTPCPQAAYVWTMTYTTKAQPRQPHQLTGTVLLLR